MKERRGKSSDKKNEFDFPENHCLPAQCSQAGKVDVGGAAFALFS